MGSGIMHPLIKTLRPHQWYKNLLLFIGLAFSFNLFNFDFWLKSVFAFFIFCMFSGAVYINNDIKDIEKDKTHPTKRFRPIASGKIKIQHAKTYAFALNFFGLFLSPFINWYFFLIVCAFFWSNFLYTNYFKKIQILDAMTIGVNFIIRATAGCIAIGVPLSPWVTMCAFFLALMLAFNKRLRDFKFYNYSKHILNQLVTISACALLVCYSLYTYSKGLMVFTIPIISFFIFRYIYIKPRNLFKDRSLLLCMILWVITCVVILYLI